MTGTFGGALEARGIPAGGGRLRSEVRGEVELDGGVLVLRRVHAAYTLTVDADADRDKIERVHGFHADKCPVARSIRDAIAISTSYELVAAPPDHD
ncbi:OsmC family protein [Egicoccus sp. AB-alg2]|uniref:OsmC family protein n=1 Tax=Egicoccus sp. AB-alg2 TaxID=3242693 RepID=UPI00359D7361